MSKNVFDYIKMGLRSKQTIEEKNKEAQLKRETEANAFDKAFTDKTYTVAKKVLDNVEKVADYDYDALFDRVNKVIDSKMPKTTKNVSSSKEREYRSKEFDKNVSNHKDRFNIDDYLNKQSNYKNSIIEKTKKNIQKKYTEAEIKNKSSKKEINVKLDIDKSCNRKIKDHIDLHPPKKVEGKTSVSQETNKTTSTLINDKTTTSKKNVFEVIDDSLDQTIQTIDQSLDTSITQLDKKLLHVDKAIESSVDSVALKTDLKEKLEPQLVEVKPIEVKEEKNVDSKVDEIIEENEILKETSENHKPLIKEPILEKESLKDEPVSDKKSNVEEVVGSKINITDNNNVVESHNESPDINANKSGKSEAVNTHYSKEEQVRQNKYYKNKKRDKFAKRMKVELEDSLIGQKKRSFKRLFKFSLSFKLSFVFMLLIVLTVISLSVAFYFGIDYVIELKEMGKLEDIQFFKDVLIVLLIIFDMAAVLMCVSLGTKASRELVRPINEMTQIVNQISAKDMNRRLNVKGMHDELKELAMTFNEMLDRIENSYETQNRFTSDASHELRTPIAVIQGYINMLDRWGKADGEILDESIEAIKSESHNMKRLTEKLLLLAKADKGILEMDFQPFELNDLIKEISRETSMIDSSHEITNEINEVKTILADRESLKQAIRIFVDNSVKYTPEGGKISINSYINKKKIYIEIADNGIGISKEDMDNIFNRFYRVDKSRTKESGGHGLGLSIAKWIISQHKGEIEVKSELNKGTVVTLVLSPINNN